MTESKLDFIKKVGGTFLSIREHLEQKYPDKRWLIEPAVKYFELVQEGMLSGRPMLWHYLTFCPELFRAMDVTTFSPEYVCATIASLPGGMNFKYLDIANEHFPEHICSLNKFPVGLALSNDIVTPDMIIYAAANPCDATITAYSNLEHYCKIPSYYLDIPYISNDRAHKYIAKQFEGMVSFIERQSKQKLDLDRLREMLDYSNQAYDYIFKLNNLRKNTPSPTSGRALFITGGAAAGLSGLPEFVSWCRRQYEVAREKAEKGKGAIPDEKIRLVWIANGVDFSFDIYDWLERKYGAVTVASLLSEYPIEPIDIDGDESTIFEGLAMRMVNFPMARQGRGPVDVYISECIGTARDYKADAVIFAGNTGCKYNWATAQLVKDMIYDELGIPTLSFELDPWDSRVLSLDSIKAKFEQFFEIIL